MTADSVRHWGQWFSEGGRGGVAFETLAPGPSPAKGEQALAVVLVLDNGPIHTSKATTAALAARPWITVEWLPRYAPELNDIEGVWRDLKRHQLAHQTFHDVTALDNAIPAAVTNLNKECQMPHQ